MHKDVYDALLDPSVLIEAFNSAFERYDLQYLLGITIPPERFIDPQVGGRYLALPADLESVCEILDLPPHLTKDKRGDALIDLFCKPKYPKKKEGEPQGEPYFNDWNSHPAEWEQFGEYCRKDVDAEEEVMRRLEILEAMPMPEFERKLWIFDQTVSDRGIPTDLEFAQKAYKLALNAKAETLASQNKTTGLANANSRDQLLPWAKERGYPYNTLNKSFVEAVLGDPAYTLTAECREVLTARLTAGSNSYTKLAAIMRHICPDGRLRNQFIYLGSPRCGRWSGSGAQPHNFPRPSQPKKVNGHDFEEIEVLIEARQMIYEEDYEGIKKKYGSVLEVIKSTLRTVFVAPGSRQQ
jgi:DNA polymerase